MEESKITQMKEALAIAHRVYVDEFGKDMIKELSAIDKEMICKLGMSLFITGRRNGVESSETQEPATEKQKAYMGRLKLDVPAGITKQEAMAAIDKKLGKS